MNVLGGLSWSQLGILWCFAWIADLLKWASALLKSFSGGVNYAKFALLLVSSSSRCTFDPAVAMVTVLDRNYLYKFKIKMKLWILSGCFDVYLPSIVAL